MFVPLAACVWACIAALNLPSCASAGRLVSGAQRLPCDATRSPPLAATLPELQHADLHTSGRAGDPNAPPRRQPRSPGRPFGRRGAPARRAGGWGSSGAPPLRSLLEARARLARALRAHGSPEPARPRRANPFWSAPGCAPQPQRGDGRPSPAFVESEFVRVGSRDAVSWRYRRPTQREATLGRARAAHGRGAVLGCGGRGSVGLAPG